MECNASATRDCGRLTYPIATVALIRTADGGALRSEVDDRPAHRDDRPRGMSAAGNGHVVHQAGDERKAEARRKARDVDPALLVGRVRGRAGSRLQQGGRCCLGGSPWLLSDGAFGQLGTAWPAVGDRYLKDLVVVEEPDEDRI